MSSSPSQDTTAESTKGSTLVDETEDQDTPVEYQGNGDTRLSKSPETDHDGTSSPSPDSDLDPEIEGVNLPTPPDGGWGWMVVLGSFFIHVIADGVAYSSGVFYVEFLDYFGASRGVTGWVGSLMVGVTWGSGPIASALVNKYECRAVTIAGSIMACVGFIISIFAPNIYFLYFSLGIVAGVGLGLIYLPAIVSVTYYFEKRRAFATGLAVCGSGVGTFIFAPLSEILIREYGWKGAMLILAALLLNCAVCGALFRPLQAKPTKKPSQGGEVEMDTKSLETDQLMSKENSPTSQVSAPNGGIPLGADASANAHETGQPIPSVAVTSHLSSSFHSLPFHSQPLSQARHRGNLEGRLHTSDMYLHKLGVAKHSHKGLLDGTVPSVDRRDKFYSASLHNIPLYRSNPSMYMQSVLSLADDGPLDEDACFLFRWFGCSKKTCDSLREMTDFSLLKDPLFLMFGISNFLTSIGFCVPYIYLPDRAILLGYSDEKGAFLISVIGIANTIGRVFFGWLSDRPWMNRLFLYNTVLTLCGACTFLSAFFSAYGLLIAYSASFGMFIGVYVSLTSVVLVDLLGLDRLTNSFGLILLFQGVAAIIGPPIAGWIFDATGDYKTSFWVMGILIGLSGLMLFFIPLVRRWQERKSGVSQHDVDMGKRVTDEKKVFMSNLSVDCAHV